jgi:hypothetical protein
MGFIRFTESLDEKRIRETARKYLSYICLIFDGKVHLVAGLPSFILPSAVPVTKAKRG